MSLSYAHLMKIPHFHKHEDKWKHFLSGPLCQHNLQTGRCKKTAVESLLLTGLLLAGGSQ